MIKNSDFKKRILFFETLDSTNTQAEKLAERGEKEWTTVACNSQTDGRGRMGRNWYSPPDTNLYFSVILRPAVAAAKIFHIAMLAATALLETLNSNFRMKCKIKWPNDIMVNSKKIAGILIESRFEGDRVRFCVLGIGINCNESFENSELKNTATSIRLVSGKKVDKEALLYKALKNLGKEYSYIKKKNYKKIYKRWLKNITGIGKTVDVNLPSMSVNGTLKEIKEDGSAVIVKKNRSELIIKSGELFLS